MRFIRIGSYLFTNKIHVAQLVTQENKAQKYRIEENDGEKSKIQNM